MSRRMLLVSDANIFIDFDCAGLSEQLFRLPDEIVVPDVLYEEELATQHAHLVGLGLGIRTLTGEQVAAAYAFQEIYRSPSINDLLALTLARALGCTLATGDRSLRFAATQEGIETIGTLALMERLHAHAIVLVDEMHAAYERMRARNRRLPWNDVANQLARLRGPL